MEKVGIISYEDRYHNDFKKLSYEWLEKYVFVEPEDERILNDPKEVILDEGGYIFLAKTDDKIVGTVALIKVDNDTFELAKLAVTEEYKGLKIGTKLMMKCLDVAKKENYKKIILYTNHNLEEAMALYKKFKFKEISIEENKYMGSDIKMELNI